MVSNDAHYVGFICQGSSPQIFLPPPQYSGGGWDFVCGVKGIKNQYLKNSQAMSLVTAAVTELLYTEKNCLWIILSNYKFFLENTFWY